MYFKLLAKLSDGFIYTLVFIYIFGKLIRQFIYSLAKISDGLFTVLVMLSKGVIYTLVKLSDSYLHFWLSFV